MKLTIKRQILLKMLNYANQAIPAKSAENQFLNFLIIVSADKVSIIASDGTLSTKVEQSAKDEKGEEVILNEEEGMIQVPAKYLLDIVSKLGGNVVTLNMVDTNYLNISDDATNFNLVTKDGKEYPDIDLNIPEESHGFAVPLKDLKKLYDTTAYAVATKGPKEIYYGINVSVRNGKLYFLTTDSYRMARYAVEEKGEGENVAFTCPVKALSMVSNIETESECTIYLDDQRALFSAGGILISTRLLRGDFPDAERLIPPQFPYSVTVDTSEFLSAADRVKIISSAEDKNSQVRLTISRDNGVVLYAKSTNYGNSEEVLRKATYILPEGENVFEIGFNVDFAIEAVKALKSDKFTFIFSAPTRMFMVKNDDPENIQIITPIRISSF